jgi:hypothetical protein
MPGSADFVQHFVHAIETGATARWIRRVLALLAVIGIAVVFLYNFRGLATSQAMDQAQIARALVSGQGWHTNYARPLAIGQLQRQGRNVAQQIWVDTYNAPLPSLVNAVALFPIKSYIKTASAATVYPGDRAIVVLAILFLLGSIFIQFFIAARLFDEWLAFLACSLTLLCNMMWQYSVSGLPQMLLLFLFNATLYFLVRAIEANYRGGAVVPWLAAVGAGFGLLALTHGLTIWIFAAALIFISSFFRPRVRATAVVLFTFLILYGPWLVRNWMVCGNPAGVAMYSVLDGLGRSETGWMRQLVFHTDGIGPGAFREKIVANIILQMDRIYAHLGWSVVALMFFVSSLHVFKRIETSVFRWMLLTMWAGAFFGIAVFGLNEEQDVSANQLHLLFIPLMTCYGLAWLLVQWNRLGTEGRFARVVFIAVLFLLCSFPLGNSLYSMILGPPRVAFRWPPYVPPYIGVLNTWMQPREITASDMPWAIAWYANRRSVLIPETVKTLTDWSDYDQLGGPVSGLYLTPISGMDNKLRDITKGDYREWVAVIEQNADISKLPFKWGTLVLGFDKECAFLSDRDRSQKATP